MINPSARASDWPDWEFAHFQKPRREKPVECRIHLNNATKKPDINHDAENITQTLPLLCALKGMGADQ